MCVCVLSVLDDKIDTTTITTFTGSRTYAETLDAK